MAKAIEAVQEEEVAKIVEATGNNQEQVLSFEEGIKSLLSNGGIRRNNLTVKNVNIQDKGTYTQVSLTLVPKVDGYISDPETGEFKLSKTDVIFTSSFAIAGTFKQDGELAVLANGIVSKPGNINYLINGGTVDIIQLHVPAETEYINPFSTNQTPVTWDHDVIINHCVKFTLGKAGKVVLDRLADQVAASFIE